MKKIKIKAIFKGSDSLGYKKDTEYTLIIQHKKLLNITIERVDTEYTLIIQHKKLLNITIERVDGSGKCEYTTLITFLSNWDNIRKL